MKKLTLIIILIVTNEAWSLPHQREENSDVDDFLVKHPAFELRYEQMEELKKEVKDEVKKHPQLTKEVKELDTLVKLAKAGAEQEESEDARALKARSEEAELNRIKKGFFSWVGGWVDWFVG